MKKYLRVLLFALCIVGCNRHRISVDMTDIEAGTILNDVSARNKAYQPLTERDDTMMQRVVAYYNKYGTPNKRMEAYYLLGSVYRDLHDAPKAMEAFLDGINAADTTSKDCRYDILARLYAQKSDIYYLQNLYTQSMEADKMVYKYAVLAKDSLFLVAAKWGEIGKCYALGDYQTIADKSWSLLRESKRLRLFSYGASYLCTSVLANVELGRFDDAQRLLSIYEQYGGSVDMEKHECSFPIYYYAKGRVLAAAGKLDSAELFYRKELTAQDWNNRQAAYRGLRMVFEQKDKADSLAKYAALQCDAVDSAYQENLSQNLQNLHELYDYSRAQEDSYKKSLLLEKERRVRQRMWWSAAVCLIILILVTYHFRTHYRQKVAEAELDLERARTELAEQEACLLQLRGELAKAETDLERQHLIQEMEWAERGVEQQKRIVNIKDEKLSMLRIRARLVQKEIKGKYEQTRIFKILRARSKSGKAIQDTEIKILMDLLLSDDPELLQRLYQSVPDLTDRERIVFMLVRLGLNRADISRLISRSQQALSATCENLYRKATGQRPITSAEAYEWLLNI